jgi:hypothetical protein
MNTVVATIKMMDWSRKLFLVVGLVMAISGIYSADAFLGLFGSYFAAKSYFNWGCGGVCNTSSCSIPENKPNV